MNWVSVALLLSAFGGAAMSLGFIGDDWKLSVVGVLLALLAEKISK